MSLVAIKPLLMVLVAVFGGTAYTRYLLKEECAGPAMAWFFIVTVTFLTTNLWAAYFSLVIVSMFMAPINIEKKVYFYIAILPVLPLTYRTYMDFPGITYLIELTPLRVLNLAMAVPLYLKMSASYDRKVESGLDKAVVFYCVLEFVLFFRDNTITNALRNGLYIAVDIWVPYFVISRAVTNFAAGFIAVLFSGIVLMFVGLAEGRMSTKTYQKIIPFMGVRYTLTAMMAYKRDFGLRVNASMGGPIPFAYFLALNGLIAYCWVSKVKKMALYGSILVAGFVLAILLTGSRGGLMALCVGLFAVWFYSFIARRWWVFISAAAAVALYFLVFSFTSLYGILGQFDSEGTFIYRLNLLSNSMEVIKKNPLFGNPKFIEDPALEASRQGQGIIDIVNTYLQVVLSVGIVGLLSFVSIFYISARGVLLKAVSLGGSGNESGMVGVLLFAMLMATVFLIATCSTVQFIPTYYWLLVALSSAYLRDNDAAGVR